MALKPDRSVIETDITLTCETAAEMGQVLVHKTSGSGVAMGDSRGKAEVVANPSGKKVAGLLMNDFVSLDETRFHRNRHKDEHVVGDPATLLRKGWVVTNKIIGTPAVDDVAYLSSSGNVTPTLHPTGGLAATPKVGKFKSILDEEGYAVVEPNLPVV